MIFILVVSSQAEIDCNQDRPLSRKGSEDVPRRSFAGLRSTGGSGRPGIVAQFIQNTRGREIGVLSRFECAGVRPNSMCGLGVAARLKNRENHEISSQNHVILSITTHNVGNRNSSFDNHGFLPSNRACDVLFLAIACASTTATRQATHPLFFYWMQDPVAEMNSYRDDGSRARPKEYFRINDNI